MTRSAIALVVRAARSQYRSVGGPTVIAPPQSSLSSDAGVQTNNSRRHRAVESLPPAKLRLHDRKWKPETRPAPEGAGRPLPPVSPAQELVLSTVTARRFCDQHEMSLQTATGRSLP